MHDVGPVHGDPERAGTDLHMRNVLLLVAVVCGIGFAAELGFIIANPPPAVGDNPRQGWTIAWLCWLLVTVIGFAVIEGIAVFNDHGGDTLTEHIQWIAGQSPVWTGVVGLGIAAFFAWFMSHLFGRDSRVWSYLETKTPDPVKDEPDEL